MYSSALANNENRSLIFWFNLARIYFLLFWATSSHKSFFSNIFNSKIFMANAVIHKVILTHLGQLDWTASKLPVYSSKTLFFQFCGYILNFPLDPWRLTNSVILSSKLFEQVSLDLESPLVEINDFAHESVSNAEKSTKSPEEQFTILVARCSSISRTAI